MAARIGDHRRIRVAHLTMANHPIHLHRHHFSVTGTNGGWVPQMARWLESTTDVPVASLEQSNLTPRPRQGGVIKVQLAPDVSLEPDRVERFGAFMRERITRGETPFRKAYSRSIVDAIEVDAKVIRIQRSKASPEQAVIAGEQIGEVFAVYTQVALPRGLEPLFSP
jgi:hypothetical protein